MAALAREARDLHRELENAEGYLRIETAERVGEFVERAKQACPRDRVLNAIPPVGRMPSADPQSPALDTSFADVRGRGARTELEQVAAACEGASLHDRVRMLRRSIGGESGALPMRVTAMFDALAEWARSELPDRDRLEVIPEREPDPELSELSELSYGEAEAALGLIECELEHAGHA